MQQSLKYISSQLEGLYSGLEIQEFYLLIMEKLTGKTRTEIRINKNNELSPESVSHVQNYVDDLKKKVPIQYILCETQFYGFPFYVNSSVLIPRPETEELVEWILNENRGGQNILDIGTGSGCIAIALVKMNALYNITALDISQKALEVAKENAVLNDVNISFQLADITSGLTFNQKWDVIVSNPPYIPERESKEMQVGVVDFEPHEALFVPNDEPLLFYEAIARFAKEHLTGHGKLYFEIHRDFGENTVRMLQNKGFKHIELRKDISGNDRMIRCSIK